MDEWKPRTEVVVGEIPHYTNPDQFTVKIFHGGRIKDNNYVGGSIDYYDNCDKDMMSLTEVHAMVRSLKHSGRIDYWYSIGSEDDALTKLSCDTDVTDMCSFVPDFRLIIMYLDHLDLHVVNLERFSCTCRRWDLTGIPCKHGVSAIHFMRKKPEDFVDKCYLKSTYMEIYGNIILPVNGMDLWERYEHPPILPPRYNRQPGRPRTKRIKDASEKEEKSGHKLGRSQRSLRCGNCKEFGHNVKTCQRHLPPKSNKRKRVSKKEASTSANPTQTEATVGLERKLLMRKNFLRDKSKIRGEEAKKKRNAKKASSAQGSTRNTSKASSSAKASQTKATS